MGQVDGKIAIVTGGASGIGRASAEILAHEGASVVVADTDSERGARMALTCGVRSRFRALDVTNESAWRALIAETAADFGGLDILLNYADIGIVGRIVEFQLGDWRWQSNLDSQSQTWRISANRAWQP